MKRVSLFTLLLSLLMFAACQNQRTPEEIAQAKLVSASSMELPTLLQHPEALMNGKEWDDVQNFYGAQCAALRKNPSDYDARLKLAECFIQEARVTGEHPHYYPAALAMTNVVIDNLENKPEQTIKDKDFLFRALSHKASVQLSLHDFGAALETAQKASVLNPYNAYVYGCLVDANVELGHYDEAVKMCDKMMSIRPDIRSYSRVSYLREIHGDPKGAIEAMKLAVGAGYPGYEQTEWARLQLGHLYERYGSLKDAENEFNTTLEAREKYPFAIAALAGLEMKKKNYDKALTLLHEAAAIIPEVSFYTSMAHIYQQTGQQDKVQEVIPKIEAMFAEDMAAGHDVRLEAARFQLEVVGNADKALEFAKEEYQRRPDNNDVNALMAAIYLKKNDAATAKAYAETAKRTGSKDPELKKLMM